MAFGWFKKNKNNSPPVPAEDQVAEIQEDDAPSPESEPQEEASAEETAAEDQRHMPEQAVPDVSEELDDDAPPAPESVGYFKRLKNRLSKSRRNFSDGFEKVLVGKKKLDEDALEELEELLITSDIGVQTTMALMERLATAKVANAEEVKQLLKEEILSILPPPAPVQETHKSTPHVILVVGVNGVGKTTTIGKLAASLNASGKKVLIAAADTFRAAAVEQLMIWAQKAGAEFVKHADNADPAAVAFDAVAAAKARGCDIVLIDTAGRLHTKVNLMQELKKIKRTVAKQIQSAPHEILLVLDATTGQNALSQATLFNEALAITGLALTKLDGTAKGGIVIAICSSLNVPLQYIGIGEKVEDLRPFDAGQFIDALFEP
ncbi:MAG: signal recognition particle-docking protein FtsY [Desulfobacterales bacterium]|jgi:fused signal recognition particle receptor